MGVIGGIIGGEIFTLLYPSLKELMGANKGMPQVFDFFTEHSLLVVLIFSTILLLTAYFLPNLEFKDEADYKGRKNL
ncbi:hypothetical protein JHD47_00140 [Sulfurimonas sp. SAG-AH-194-L11]|nr:hypothetical protein [Sulfurimonas sp. SAG-AH-194-L11]MDF1876222.1 hypothetical protein [Sulfurimonas sp. SAG-AH-194-L11]